MMAASPECVNDYAGGVVNFVEHLFELLKDYRCLVFSLSHDLSMSTVI